MMDVSMRKRASYFGDESQLIDTSSASLRLNSYQLQVLYCFLFRLHVGMSLSQSSALRCNFLEARLHCPDGQRGLYCGRVKEAG